MKWHTFKHVELDAYDAVIVTGGDGAIRRCLNIMHAKNTLLPILINPQGSFNVIAKQHRLGDIGTLLDAVAQQTFTYAVRPYYTVNDTETFLFSAGNMGDLHHIFLADTLRFGLLKRGLGKYLAALALLLPAHLFLTPFMLMSDARFFIFTPMPFPKKLGSFYNDIDTLHIDTQNSYHFVELDGDIVLFQDAKLHLQKAGEISVITSQGERK